MAERRGVGRQQGKARRPCPEGPYIQACPKESHPDALILVLNLLCVTL